MQRWLFFVAGWLALGSSAAAQPVQPHFTTFTAEDGLAHNTVTAFLQDRQGFLWIGTLDGLSRFDGQTFTTFRPEPGNPYAPASAFIHGLLEADDGTLWLGTRTGGLCRYTPTTERFRCYQPDPADPFSIPELHIQSMQFGPGGGVWIRTENGTIGWFERATERFIAVRLTPGTEQPLATPNLGPIFTTDGALWVTTPAGRLFRAPSAAVQARPAADAAGSHPVVLRVAEAARLPDGVAVLSLQQVGDGHLWAGTTQGLWKLDQAARHFQQQTPASWQQDATFFQVTPAAAWVGTRGEGLYRLDRATGQMAAFRAGDASGFSNDRTASLYQDREGILWVGTWGGGMNRLDPASRFRLLSEATVGLHQDFALAVTEDIAGTRWLSAGGRLHRLGTGSARAKVFAPGEGGWPGSNTWAITQGRDALWIATQTAGLCAVRNADLAPGATVRFRCLRHDTTDPTSLAADNVYRVFEDRRGWLWIGLEGAGIDLVTDPAGLLAGREVPFYHLPHWPEPGAGTEQRSPRVFYEDGAGAVWVGTYLHGAMRLQPFEPRRTGVPDFDVLRLPYLPDDPYSLPHPDVRGIHQDSTGHYWFATLGGGLTRWTPDTETFTTYGRADGLPNEELYAVLPDALGYLWLPTNNGLARFDPRTETFRVFTEREGLQGNEFNTGAHYISDSGLMYAGGVGGMSVFDPRAFADRAAPPPVTLTGLDIFGQPYRTEPAIAVREAVTLPHDQNFLTLRYVAPELVEPGQVRYRYQLLGLDPQVVAAGTRREAPYTDLRPGSYTFHVEAFYQDAPLLTSAATLGVTITPPWWQTDWFRAGAVLLLLGALVGGVRYFSTRKLRAEVQRLETEQRVQAERTRISRDLHDHIGAQLSGLVSGLDLATRFAERQDTDRHEQLIGSLKTEARHTITELRNTIWALNQPAVDVADLADRLRRFANDQRRFVEQTQLHVTTEKLTPWSLSPTEALHLFRIAQEALQNALKYADAAHIHLTLATDADRLTLTVRDDGTFRPPDPHADGGHGLIHMRQRAEQIGGTFAFDGTETGTTVTVVLPRSENAP